MNTYSPGPFWLGIPFSLNALCLNNLRPRDPWDEADAGEPVDEIITAASGPVLAAASLHQLPHLNMLHHFYLHLSSFIQNEDK